MLNSREEKLKIARLAYIDIMHVIDYWENHTIDEIHCHWDECITVEDELFHGPELRKDAKRK